MGLVQLHRLVKKQILTLTLTLTLGVLVMEHIQSRVIQQNEVLLLLFLRLIYDPIKDHVYFMKVDYDKADTISFCFVYSSNITLSNVLA